MALTSSIILRPRTRLNVGEKNDGESQVPFSLLIDKRVSQKSFTGGSAFPGSMVSNTPFAEGAFAILPENWQEYCLDWGYLKSCVEACTLKGAEVPAVEQVTTTGSQPSLPANLQSDIRHRKFAELLVTELNVAHSFIIKEWRKCATDLAAVETLATSYIQEERRARLRGGCGSSVKQDPYIRNRLKNALVFLYHEHTRHVSFRMLNHGVVCRLARLQAELVCELVANTPPATDCSSLKSTLDSSSSASNEEDGNTMCTDSLEKELTMFALSHELFSGLPRKMAAASTAADSFTTSDLIELYDSSSEDASHVDDATNTVGECHRIEASLQNSSIGDAVPVLREEEIATLYAVLFCHGDLEVARAALTYYSPDGGASVFSPSSTAGSVTAPSRSSFGGSSSFQNLLSMMVGPSSSQRRGPVGRTGGGLVASLSGEVMVWLYCNFIITVVKLFLFPFDLSSGGLLRC